jgi:hypothetical protein
MNNETLAPAQAFTKVVEIATREWFDKINGNSYWSAHATVTTTPQELGLTYVFTFTYGYGDHSTSAVLDTLAKLGEIPSTHYRDLKNSGIMVISHKRTGCRKAELMHDKDTKGMTKVLPGVFASR